MLCDKWSESNSSAPLGRTAQLRGAKTMAMNYYGGSAGTGGAGHESEQALLLLFFRAPRRITCFQQHTPERARTSNLLLRRQLLCPVELRGCKSVPTL